MFKKLKSFLADDAIFMALLLILVAIVSFGLGRQSVKVPNTENSSTQSAGVVFTESPFKQAKTDPASVDNSTESTGDKSSTRDFNDVKEVGKVVASKSGTKYHLLTCPGAKQIKEANKIYFDTVEQAKAAGYSPAANCKGLE